jgi:hypothetical protein
MEVEHARKGYAEAEAWLKEPPEPLRCEGCPLLKEQEDQKERKYREEHPCESCQEYLCDGCPYDDK